MYIQNKLTDLKDQKSYSIPAKRVMEHLKPILSKSNDLRQRWMWELLQNASDLGDNVKARFEITADNMKFSHNGKPFSLDEAYNLIMPDSTKDDETTHKKSVIGQFGTGFISTHILSKIIQIDGIIEDDERFYSFNFHLDRSERNDKDFLIQSIKDAEAEYRENLKEIDKLPEDEFQTSFTYDIDNTYSSLKGQEIVDDGIESFKELIPYVLTFRPQLTEIEVIDRRTTTTKFTFKRDVVESDIEDLIIIKTVCHKDGKHIEDRLIGKIIEDETEIAFPIEEIGVSRFQLLPFPEKCPRLFCAFPMIGTSDFNFPVVVHSEKILPNRERDGLELTDFDEENRERLVEAKIAFRRLLEIIQENEWTEAFNICRFSNPNIADPKTKRWFVKKIFIPIKEGILNTKLIELDSSLELDEQRISLSTSYIPYADRRTKNKKKIVKKIYKFAFQVMAKKIPCSEHFLKWYEVLDFEIFESKKLDIERLCEMVSNPGKNNIKNNTVNFYVDLVSFVIKKDKRSLLNKHRILVDQKNKLRTTNVLKLDEISHKQLNDDFDEKLKNIYASLTKKDCRNFLLHKNFEKIYDILEKEDKYYLKELAKDIDEELRNYEVNFHDENFLLILKNLFSWYTTCGLSDETLKNLFPYFSQNKSQLYLNTKTAKELEYAFDIEISGKSEVLAKLANSSLSENELEIIAVNPKLVSNFIEWINSKQEDNPNEELGDIGEEFLHFKLCQIFGEDRVLWEDKSEYDFRILETDLDKTKYYIDAKTTGKGIANAENVPFYMRTAQWHFLDREQAFDKYVIARVYKNGSGFDVKYVKINLMKMK
jgi:hypothetical protein